MYKHRLTNYLHCHTIVLTLSYHCHTIVTPLYWQCETYVRVDGVLQSVNDLVHLGHLQTGVSRQAHLSSNEPADGHGLEDPVPCGPGEAGQLAPRHARLQIQPWLGVFPRQADPGVLKLETSVCQEESDGLPPQSVVEVLELDSCHTIIKLRNSSQHYFWNCLIPDIPHSFTPQTDRAGVLLSLPISLSYQI